MSREISLIDGYDGVAKAEFTPAKLSADRESACGAPQSLTSAAFGATDGRALRCSLNVQKMLANEPGSRVLCRTLAFTRKEAPLQLIFHIF